MKNKLKPYLLLLPVTIILLGVMGVGVINCIAQSLGYFPQIGLTELTFDYYREVLRNTTFLKSLLFTLKTSFISASLSVILGVWLSYVLMKEKFSKFRRLILNTPIVVPHIVVVLLMFITFSQSGMVSRVLYKLNIIDTSSQFISIVSDQGGIGIIMVYLWKGIPYTTITTYNILRNMSDKLESVAINLGANKLQSFRYIILPLAMPSIISAFIMLFAFAFGSFEVPFLIGPSTPKTLAVQAYLSYSSSDLFQRPDAMVMNVTLSLISFVLLIVYNRVFEKFYKYKL
ncbi:ABC transporter permease [Asaccharospora irregularis]|uniref:Putative spermidine/putrescine transport system permease protein n=1 Tax=Asaccharospora irregularis DSM 2635 TaxID=1121321 RepID=A0A1M5MN84_9FIRM|nr:ABC transporter permease subunit [Asaccharospora irregularis]SHG78850.1 putative spermidine/putrescine transport system permease protein [Asaccharospora irregularis DSM 2635]